MECSYAECYENSYSTAFLTVDAHDVRWFCGEHWYMMGLLFKMVSKCVKANKCERNHNAEINMKHANIVTVKHNSKFFDLCDKHNGIYEELLGINSLFEYD